MAARHPYRDPEPGPEPEPRAPGWLAWLANMDAEIVILLVSLVLAAPVLHGRFGVVGLALAVVGLAVCAGSFVGAARRARVYGDARRSKP